MRVIQGHMNRCANQPEVGSENGTCYPPSWVAGKTETCLPQRFAKSVLLRMATTRMLLLLLLLLLLSLILLLFVLLLPLLLFLLLPTTTTNTITTTTSTSASASTGTSTSTSPSTSSSNSSSSSSSSRRSSSSSSRPRRFILSWVIHHILMFFVLKTCVSERFTSMGWAPQNSVFKKP